MNPIAIYAEATPNPSAIKFVANKMLIPGTVDFPDRKSAEVSPFASQLFEFSCVAGVFISGNFATITKTPDSDWNDIMPILREFMRSYMTSGDPILNEAALKEQTGPAPVLTEEESASIENQIKQILDEYIRPAVEQDGGAIGFKSFENGRVTVTLQGSCSGCPSSTITLKAGIENLLKRMVPTVTEVVSEAL